jgi:hypothetical protein
MVGSNSGASTGVVVGGKFGWFVWVAGLSVFGLTHGLDILFHFRVPRLCAFEDNFFIV